MDNFTSDPNKWTLGGGLACAVLAYYYGTTGSFDPALAKEVTYFLISAAVAILVFSPMLNFRMMDKIEANAHILTQGREFACSRQTEIDDVLVIAQRVQDEGASTHLLELRKRTTEFLDLLPKGKEDRENTIRQWSESYNKFMVHEMLTIAACLWWIPRFTWLEGFAGFFNLFVLILLVAALVYTVLIELVGIIERLTAINILLEDGLSQAATDITLETNQVRRTLGVPKP